MNSEHFETIRPLERPRAEQIIADAAKQKTHYMAVMTHEEGVRCSAFLFEHGSRAWSFKTVVQACASWEERFS